MKALATIAALALAGCAGSSAVIDRGEASCYVLVCGDTGECKNAGEPDGELCNILLDMQETQEAAER